MKPRVLVLRSAGTNCDEETAFGFSQVGGEPHRVHVNQLVRTPALLRDYQILSLPGGFSYGDDIASGKILANQIVHHLQDELHRFVQDGKPVIGICNGFQVLVKTDLLPGLTDAAGGRGVTLTNNSCGRFVDRWVHLKVGSEKCVWTRGLDRLELPVAHGEGQFVTADAAVLAHLRDHDQIALTYTTAAGEPAAGRFPDNPNGSVADIAGICDASGLVLGLMPHPERYLEPFQHPAWTSGGSGVLGLELFRNAVSHVAGAALAPALEPERARRTAL